ncbi:MAG: hypothetical protein GXP26_06215 [Planctomycetes bacterium]|nr:hypothetical protein [Planctomycetota bacterium]
MLRSITKKLAAMFQRLAIAMLVCVIVPGCFSADTMIEKRRAIAILTRLEEIDLGEFRISVPRPSEQVAAAEIFFHAFGQVENRDLRRVQKSLEIYGPELRHRLLLATRALDIQDLEDPKLASLRENIATVINENLKGEPLQSVGFYNFRYSNL